MTAPTTLASTCEAIYARYHDPRYISPDPLEVVRGYRSIADREVAGFIASALALGRVEGIVAAARWVLNRLGSRQTLTSAPEAELRELAATFVYRFFDGEQLYGLLLGLRRVIGEYGSLERCFAAGIAERPPDPALVGLAFLVERIVTAADGRLDHSILVARPEKGSACKRLLLFLRWMVRDDAIDPGGWTALSAADLLVPVDTHMLRVTRSLRLTSAKQPSLRVAHEVTAAFREIAPEDPVRYDFSLTRPGIHPVLRRESPWRPGQLESGRLTQPA